MEVTSKNETTLEVDNDAERKLWLDYLRSLNDRRLQAARNSGLTNYALAGALAGLLYWSFPRLRQLLATSGAPEASLIILVLLADACAYIFVAYGLLIYYCVGGVEHRVYPEPRRRVNNVTRGAFVFAGTALGFGQLWIGVRLRFPSLFVRWSVIGLGLWWASNILYGVVKRTKVSREAKKKRILLPTFTRSSMGPDPASLLVIAVLLLVGVFAAIALGVYLRNIPVDWLTPLSAAGVFLIFFVILGYLFWRGVQAAGQLSYDALERNILVEQLSASEIRSRFIREALGPETSAWLDELLSSLRIEDDKLLKASDAAKLQLEEIARIDPEYAIERKARAQKAAEDLTKAKDHHKESLDSFQLQMKVFLEAYKTKKDHEMLRRWFRDLEKQFESSKKVIEDSKKQISELRGIAETQQGKSVGAGQPR